MKKDMRQNKTYKTERSGRTGYVFLILVIVLIAVFLISFMLGRYPVSVARVLEVFADRIMKLFGFRGS